MASELTGCLKDFTAYELPTKKWMKLFSPKARLRVRVGSEVFVSSVVKVGNRPSNEPNISCTHWADKFSRPSINDDEILEVEVERRFLIGYTCIRRTRQATWGTLGTHGASSADCALSLHDGLPFVDGREERITMGRITFTLSDETGTSEKHQQPSGSRDPMSTYENKEAAS